MPTTDEIQRQLDQLRQRLDELWTANVFDYDCVCDVSDQLRRMVEQYDLKPKQPAKPPAPVLPKVA